MPELRTRSRSNADCVASAMAGDQAGWDALVDRFSQMVWSIAMSYGLTATDAADVSQITWLHLVDALGRLEDPARVDAWLTATARRESLRVLRLTGTQLPSSQPSPALLAY